MNEKILVDKEALRSVLSAISGPGHLIRELLTINHLKRKGIDKDLTDPIGTLLDDYHLSKCNGWVSVEDENNRPEKDEEVFVAHVTYHREEWRYDSAIYKPRAQETYEWEVPHTVLGSVWIGVKYWKPIPPLPEASNEDTSG